MMSSARMDFGFALDMCVRVWLQAELSKLVCAIMSDVEGDYFPEWHGAIFYVF